MLRRSEFFNPIDCALSSEKWARIRFTQPGITRPGRIAVSINFKTEVTSEASSTLSILSAREISTAVIGKYIASRAPFGSGITILR